MKFYKKTIFFAIAIFGFFTNFVSANSFSLQIIQKNVSENVVYNASYLIEQSIMDYFFDSGYIVSNTPVLSQSKNQNIDAELQQSFDSAQAGLLDLVIELSIFYDLKDSTNPEEALLKNIEKIEWSVISIKNRNKISSGKVVPKNYKNDESSLVSFSYEVANYIKNEIETKGGQK